MKKGEEKKKSFGFLSDSASFPFFFPFFFSSLFSLSLSLSYSFSLSLSLSLSLFLSFFLSLPLSLSLSLFLFLSLSLSLPARPIIFPPSRPRQHQRWWRGYAQNCSALQDLAHQQGQKTGRGGEEREEREESKQKKEIKIRKREIQVGRGKKWSRFRRQRVSK